LASSTALEINALFNPDRTIDEKELCFSSNHPSGAHAGFADGHVEFVSETIDRNVWSTMGTRSGGEPSSPE